jgi:adenylate cyclase class 2
MPLEIEIKLKTDDHGPILERLRALNAKHAGTVRETNIFFDRPDRSLRFKDSGLRIRLTPGTALLTFKGPPQQTGLRAREAYDVTCTPAEQLAPLIEALGFERIMSFEKDRDSWLFDDCHIELDTLPHFGKFLEIEGPSEEIVAAVQKKLGLQNISPFKQSYSQMVSGYLGAAGTQDLRF